MSNWLSAPITMSRGTWLVLMIACLGTVSMRLYERYEDYRYNQQIEHCKSIAPDPCPLGGVTVRIFMHSQGDYTIAKEKTI